MLICKELRNWLWQAAVKNSLLCVDFSIFSVYSEYILNAMLCSIDVIYDYTAVTKK